MTHGLLLDTNFISQWQRQLVSAPESENLFASTATLQELYNMQEPNSWRYRYALPRQPTHQHFQTADPNFSRYLKEHADLIRKGKAWLPSQDQFLVHFPAYLAEYGFVDQREQAHNLVAELSNWPAQSLLKTVASIALGKPAAHHVCNHYQFVVESGIKPIPASSTIAEYAVELLDKLIRSGVNVKANPRNTFNDMIILATALSYDLELRTGDKLLFRAALRFGMSRVKNSEGFATLTPVHQESDRRTPEESKGYINAPWRTGRAGIDGIYRTFDRI